MLLTARMLNGCVNANTFEYTQVFQMTSGERQDLYFQLVDASKMPPTQYFFPAGLRYAPAAGSTLRCTLASIDDAKTLTRFASQPFPAQDTSIWKLSILETDTLAGTFALQLALNEAGILRKGSLQQAVQIQAVTGAFC
jgi:hypothetical protein